jgi:hypothetical protein
MSIPSDVFIKAELLSLLHSAPNNGMQTTDVYTALAAKFPQLSHDDLTIPYKTDTSGSKWKTAVRSVREKCKQEGFISKNTPRGYWLLTDAGHKEAMGPDIPELE